MRTNSFALYKGDTFIDLGTKEYLAKLLGVKPKTIPFYATPSWKKRFNPDDNNRTIVIRIDGDVDEQL